jgi:hypothetical protein
MNCVAPRALRSLPAERAVTQQRPPRPRWLRRRGAELTGRKLAEAGWNP